MPKSALWSGLLAWVLAACATPSPHLADAEAAAADPARGADHALAALRTALAQGECRATELLARPGLAALFDDPETRSRLVRLVRNHTNESTCEIAGANEPGRRLSARLRFLSADGSAAAGALVFLYHARADGRYTAEADEPGAGDRNPRFFTWLVTDDEGVIEVDTILPGGYGGAPPHFHLGVAPGGDASGPRTGGSLYFRGDWPLDPEVESDTAAGVAWLLDVEEGANGLHVSGDLKLRPPG